MADTLERIRLIGLLLLLASFAAACRPVQRLPLEPVITITLSKPEDRAEVSRQDEGTLIDLYSDSGIGGATLAWPDALPQAPLLRLHLAGLEELRVAADAVTVVASAGGAPPQIVSQAVASQEQTMMTAIASGSPNWLEITWTAAEPAAVTAGLPGYFTVHLPEAWMAKGVQEITLHWIDFYR